MAKSIEPVRPQPPELSRRRVMRQSWLQLAYFHWAYQPAVVQSLLPPGLIVDTYDDQAWVGLIPFEMHKVRLGPTPPIPWFGSFTEINVRTYVRDEFGRRGVWFFSLDVPRLAVVGVARSFFGLPYCWAKTRHEIADDRHSYSLTRRIGEPNSPTSEKGEKVHATMSFRVGGPLDAADVSELDHFLTARWALFALRSGSTKPARYGRVHHPKWPLNSVEGLRIDSNVFEAAGLPTPIGSPHAMYSPGVPVNLSWFETRKSST